MFKTIHSYLFAFLFVAATFSLGYSQEKNPPSIADKENNSSGPYYTGDVIPGDPDNGINNLKRVFKFIQIYRGRHQGIYQSKRGMVISDMLNNVQAYGFHNPAEVVASLSNPDAQYDDWSFIRNDPLRKGGAALLANRPDGSPMGGAKLPGTVDVLAQMSTYYHRNSANRKLGRTRANPTGFYLVLHDNGVVAKISYDEAFFVYQTERADSSEITTTTVFPHQASVPYNCLSYEENWATYSPPQQPHIGYPVLIDGGTPTPDNGGYESLVSLSRLLAVSLEREPVWNALGREEEEKEFALVDVQQGAQKLGLPLQLRKLSLAELQQLNAPAIFLTSDDKRIVTLSNLDDKEAIVIDRGMTRIVSRETLADKYSGEALLPQAAADPASSVAVEDPIRILSLQSTTEEIQQQVTLTNRGKEALTLQIERPIPGVTKAELSADTLAPGQSATLALSIKWRDVLKGETQNVFVFLKTNDPLRPRLQLGFQLRAPQK